MKTSITIKAIRAANANLISRGVALSKSNKYSGEVRIEIEREGVYHSKSLSKEDLNSAYKKSICEYAEKL